MTRRLSAWYAITAIWLAACGTPDASPAQPQDQASAQPRTQPLAPLPDDASPAQAVAYNAKKYAVGFAAEGAVLEGSLAEGARADHLLVLKSGRCYRIVGAAEAAVHDMDLFLYDPNGVQTDQDPSQDRFPVLGVQAEICPLQTGGYRLQVHMYQGGGAYAVGLFRNP